MTDITLNFVDENSRLAGAFVAQAEDLVADATVAKNAAQLAAAQAAANLAAALVLLITNGGVFTNTAAGILATTSGKTFFANDGSGVVRYYTNTAGTAVLTSFVLGTNGVAVTMPALSGGGSSSIVALDIIPPTGMINSAGGNDAVPARIVNQIVKFNSGPAGMENYYTSVIGFGPNINSSFGRVNTASNAGYGAGSIRVESGFIQPGLPPGASKATEFHMSTFGLDNIERRHLSIYAPTDATEHDAGANLGLRAAKLDFRDGPGNPRVQFNWAAGNNICSIANAGAEPHTIFRFSTNDRPLLQQFNAAGGATLSTGYIDSNDALRFTSGGAYLSGPIRNNALSQPAGLAMNITGMATNNNLIYASSSAVTGTVRAFRFDCSATVVATGDVRNSAGAARFLADAVDGVSDAYFAMVGAAQWVAGMDASDGAKFKICRDVAPSTGSTMFLECDNAAGTVTFGKPPRLPSFTVGGVPSASGAGAGAMIFVTNETGGAVPAFSNGTNWLRTTDRAIIA